MTAIPWALIIPALTEIAREVLSLFEKRKLSDPAKRRRVIRMLRKMAPDCPESLAALAVEAMVLGHREGVCVDTELAAFVRGVISDVQTRLAQLEDVE
jgi:hypothetical protein